MEARILQFPTGRHTGGTTQVAVGGGAAPDPAERSAVGDPYVEAVVRFSALQQNASGVGEAVFAALACMSTEDATVVLAGTQMHPTVEACLAGPDAAIKAVSAVLEADHDVRVVSGNRFVVSAGVVEGSLQRGPEGVALRAVSVPAAKLADMAAPGQILLGGDPWERHPWVEAVPALESRGPAGSPVFVLRGLR